MPGGEEQVDEGRIASLYIFGAEDVLAGNDMTGTCLLKEPVRPELLYPSYERFIRENEAVRSKWVERPGAGDGGFAWVPLAPDEVERLLALERERLAREDDLDAVYSEFSPTNERFPVRLARTRDPRTVVFLVNHAFANGLAAIGWMARFFRCYAEAAGIAVPPDPPPPAPRRRARLLRALAALAGVFWVLVYLAGFFLRAGQRAALDTVDLTDGRTPAPRNEKGYAVRRYSFSAAQTAAIREAARRDGATVNEHLCAATAEAFLAAQPARRRVLLSLPVDLRPILPHVPPLAPGNYTGSLVVQVFRGRPVGRQVRRAFRWFRRGVPLALTRLLGRFAGNAAALRARFATQARLPVPARAPLENFTCAFSSVGLIAHPVLETLLERFSGHAKTQTVFLAPATINGCLTIDVCVSNDLFRAEEVFAVTDRLAAGLAGGERVESA